MNESVARRQLPAPRTLLVLFVLLLFLPFVGKAFHIDDPLFLWVARHVQKNPLDFYGFSVNWYGVDNPISLITKNPPLFSYYLAGAATLAGWSEPAMHLAALLPVVALALGTYQLAGLLRAEPLSAALAAVCTPVFLLTGTAVMCDVPMVTLWVWAIYLWLRGMEGAGRPLLLAGAALLIAAAGLTKYFGVSLVPLLAVHALWRRVPVGRWLPYLLMPVSLFALYQWGTGRLYGAGLLADAASYATDTRGLSFALAAEGVLVGLSFAGGGILTPLFCAPFLLRPRGRLVAAGALAVTSGFLLTLGSLGGLDLRDSWLRLAQLALFVVTGGGLLVMAAADLRRERSADSLLLLLWVVGTFVFATLVNWTVSGRNILPLAPAAGILIGRRLSLLPLPGRLGSRSALTLALVPALAVAVAVTAADCRWAGEARTMARRVARLRPPGADLWFQGHWGFQYYLEQAGGKALDFVRSQPRAGDLIVTPSFGTNIEALNEENLATLRQLRTKPLSWLSTIDISLGAGFYSSLGGPLPYAFGTVNPDTFTVQFYRAAPSVVVH